MNVRYRWRICMVLLFVAAIVQTKAQNAFHVYQKNGKVNTFFYSYCDSIAYSEIESEKDSKSPEFAQFVYTPDSMYIIPVSLIDSISFYRPETVYKPGVIKLEDNLFPYIFRHDSTTLILNRNTPQELLPHKGDKLVTLVMNDIFPSGFAGEVKEIKEAGNQYMVECELPLLTDLFSSYYYDGNIELNESQKEKGQALNAPGDIIWPPLERYFNLPDASATVTMAEIGMTNGPWAATLSQSIGYTLKSKMHLRTSLSICNGLHFHITMTGEHSLSAETSASVSGSVSPDLGVEIPMRPPVAPLMEFYMKFGPVVSISGSFNGSVTQTNYFNSVLHYSYDQGCPSNIPAQIKIIPKGHDEPHGDCHGNMTLKLGAFVEMGIGILSKDIAKAGIAFEEGVKCDVRMELGGAMVSSPPNTELYDTNKENKALTISPYRGCSFRLEALYASYSTGVETTLGNPIYQNGLVPDFNNVKAEMSKDAIGELNVSADISGNCFGRHRVGFAIYQNNTLLEKTYFNKVYPGNGNMTMTHKFTGLTPGKRYTIYPMIEMFGNTEILASPCSDAELKVSVVTGTNGNITANSATLGGYMEGVDDNTICRYGMEYRLKSDVEWKVCYATINTNGYFVCNVTGLNSGSEYIYRAFLVVDGIKFVGDDIGFTTDATELSIVTGGYHYWADYDLGHDPCEEIITQVVCEGEISGFDTENFEYGIEYAIDGSDNWQKSYIILNIKNDKSDLTFDCLLENLLPDTKYLYRAFITTWDKNIINGETCSFKTKKEFDTSSLKEFYKSTNGDNWKNNSGWLKNPEWFQWYGIGRNQFGDIELNLTDNNLTGDAILRNCNYISNLLLSDNPLKSLTIDSCSCAEDGYKRLYIEVPGKGEDIFLKNLNLGIAIKPKGEQLGHIDCSSVKNDIGFEQFNYGANQMINIKNIDFHDSNSYPLYDDGHFTVEELNVSNINATEQESIDVGFSKVKKMNIRNIINDSSVSGQTFFNLGNFLDRSEDNYIDTVFIDQMGKNGNQIEFYHKVNVANLYNIDHLYLLSFSDGVNEVNMYNMSGLNISYLLHVPKPITVNISDSEIYFRKTPDVDNINIYNLKNCKIHYNSENTPSGWNFTVSFKGTAYEFAEYLEEQYQKLHEHN